MEKNDAEQLVKTTLGEIEKVLGSKTVVGEPITIGDSTIIPLLSLGFGFGGGGSSGLGGDTKKEGSEAIAGGAGGGVRPIAVIIIDKNGARIESIKGGMAAALEKVGESVPKMMEKFADKWTERKKEG